MTGKYGMKRWRVYEHIDNGWSDPYDEFVGIVEAKTAQSALNKAKKIRAYNDFDWIRIRRNPDRYIVKEA